MAYEDDGRPLAFGGLGDPERPDPLPLKFGEPVAPPKPAVPRPRRQLAVDKAEIERLMPRQSVHDWVTVFVALNGVPLVRIRGPQMMRDPRADPIAAAKEPRASWSNPQYQVRKRFTRPPQAGTFFGGLCHPSTGVVVIDVDLRFDGALDGAWDPFPRGWLAEASRHTLAVRTGQGGYHLWLRWPQDREWPGNRKLYDGPEGKIELKADGYAIIPPGFVTSTGQAMRYSLISPGPVEREDWWRIADAPSELCDWVLAGGYLPGESALSDEEIAEAVRALTGGRAVSASEATLHTPQAEPPPDGESHLARETEDGTNLLVVADDHQRDESKVSDPRLEPESPPDHVHIPTDVEALVRERLSGLLERVSTDDSDRDFAIACMIIRSRGDAGLFATIVADLPRAKSGKATRQDYIERTWQRAWQAVEASGPVPLMDAEIDQLRSAVGHPLLLRSLGKNSKVLLILRWLVEEAISRGSWTIIPGGAKIAKGVGLSEPQVHQHLKSLTDEGLIIWKNRGRANPKSISVRP